MVQPDVEARPVLELHAAGDTHIGRREHNEDTILIRPDMALYVLADGAGGENAGNVASALAGIRTVYLLQWSRGISAAETAPS